MFKNRKLIGVVDGVSWEMTKEEHKALTEHLNQSSDAKEAFAKLINCELSFESESMKNALEIPFNDEGGLLDEKNLISDEPNVE